MKVGNWEIEDSVLGEQWAAWEEWDSMLGAVAFVSTPSGWQAFTGLAVTTARLAGLSARPLDLDGKILIFRPLRDAILDRNPVTPDVGCLDWNIADKRDPANVMTRHYAAFPVRGKLWHQGMARATPQTSPEALVSVVGGPGRPAPTPYNEVIHTQTFYRESGDVGLAVEQTIQNARRKMATRSSYPVCKCCGQLTEWSTRWNMGTNGITVIAALVCPQKENK